MNILVIMNGDAYQNDLVGAIRQVTSAADKVCYISLNKTYNALQIMFDENKLDKKKFFFIDAVSGEFMKVENTDKCFYIKSAKDLNKLEKAIRDKLEESDFDTVIFDSLSTHFTYHPEDEVVRFARSLMGFLSVKYCAAIFTCLDKDKERNAIKEIKMVVDKVIEIK